MNRGETNAGAKQFKRALALTASKKPNYAKALPLLVTAERLGHAEATYALATWYLFGRHVAPSMTKALTLLKRAVRRGSADAAFDLAIAFEQGKIVERNERKAFQLYLTSAIRHRQPLSYPPMYSFREAAYEVSRCYYHGIGVAADRRAGMIWKIESKAFRSPKRTARPPVTSSSSPRRSRR
ncbi:MAG: sel1 repeat family protein [Rhodospirillales bacterium]|nr:sel1 repeat family protein [Rhodospirillales bacterium]